MILTELLHILPSYPSYLYFINSVPLWHCIYSGTINFHRVWSRLFGFSLLRFCLLWQWQGHALEYVSLFLDVMMIQTLCLHEIVFFPETHPWMDAVVKGPVWQWHALLLRV